MLIRATPQRPVELALALLDRQVVDAGKTIGHQAVFVEFPILIAVRAKPVAGVVMPFVGITHGNAVVGEGPEFLDQAVIQFPGPFTGKKTFGFFAVMDELGAVTPLGVQGVGQGHPLWVAGIPAVFGQADFFNRRLAGKGWQRRACFCGG
ncbi:hypothetical protein AO262_27260 [Pseudomonas fluorescens ABAC62]|nr:hypothetical protein AO262_27260 [Pseudomonas fluorescens ABAC62]